LIKEVKVIYNAFLKQRIFACFKSFKKSKKKCDSFCFGNGTFLQRPPAFEGNEQNTSGAFEGFFTAIFPFRRAIVSSPFPALPFVNNKTSTQKLVE